MADERLVRRLLEGVTKWNTWRREHRGPLDLANADLTGVNLSGSNLTNAEPPGANLIEANLTHVKLIDADLTNANLIDANLTYAKLANAKLTNTNLTNANLTYAKLVNADLTNANLTHAKLASAKVTGARLGGSRLNYTIFGSVDLSGALGLDAVHFEGPCVLDYHTLQLSNGKIPDSFLRGCGWDDDFIAYTRDLMSRAIDFYSCFISYSHGDKVFARRLHDQLQGQGIRCWRDEKSLKGGDRILKGVFEAIRSHDRLVLCCSKKSLASNWVEREISKAVEKELKEGRDILIPLNLDGHLFQWDHHLGDEVRSRLALDFTGWEKDNAVFEREFRRVVQALKDETLAKS